jgi:hypothetical protein
MLELNFLIWKVIISLLYNSFSYYFTFVKKKLLMSKTMLYLSWVVRVMMFNAIFNNISVISWWSVLLVEETGLPGENH